MNRRHLLLLTALALLTAACAQSTPSAPHRSDAAASAPEGAATPRPARDRTVRFTYVAQLKEIPEGARELQVWIPAPQRRAPLQEVLEESATVDAHPEAVVTPHAAASGDNRWWHVAVVDPKPPLSITVTMTVRRMEQRNNDFRDAGRTALTSADLERFREELGPYELVPIGGRIQGLAENVAGAEKNPLNVARRIYDHVLEHMRYSKDGTGWGRGDSLWACDSGYGNCTDFHSLFMSLAKARSIPARFHMGFPIPDQRGAGSVGGYHCWAEFYVSELGWVPVDISEASKHPELAQYYFGALTEDRISFVTGRDILLEPPPASGKRNLFIYPHAEVDGKEAKVERSFTYQDV